MGEATIRLEEDFEYLLSLLPMGWQEKAKELGALRRCRKVPDAKTLLRVLLIHLAEGCSLRETALRARQGGIVELSDVAILDRLRCAGEWFSWMNRELMGGWMVRDPLAVSDPRWRVRVVDATRVKEPGPTGSSWCIHYAVGLPSLNCDELRVTEHGGPGETFKRFAIQAGDLMLGDAAYGVPPGIDYVVRAKGQVLVRFSISNLPLWKDRRHRFDLLGPLRRLEPRQVADWPVGIKGPQGRWICGRVCAIRKSRQAIAKAQKEVMRRARKAGAEVQAQTLEAAGYVLVFTTLEREQLSAGHVLEAYRGRWQIELVFKRLKSILGLGHLRKSDIIGAKAWLEGKLLVALLIEALLRCAESFFPWGYPLPQQALSLARRATSVASASGHG
jgi:hypothetical protein